ncbi:UNVERIFIED_CONTAM: hypothetical protein FKN15_074139 [Acipenser sinensis]
MMHKAPKSSNHPDGRSSKACSAGPSRKVDQPFTLANTMNLVRYVSHSAELLFLPALRNQSWGPA